jgi:predicted outer membrane repeat protein
VFTNNTSNASGGAVTAGSPDDSIPSIVNITACIFSGNQASSTGGALRLFDDAYIQNTTLSNNTAESSGGAIDASSASLTISDTIFTSNVAIANGGAIYTSEPLVANHIVFTGNTAEGNGGAVYHFSSANFSNCSFTENSSQAYGGAISAQPNSSLIVSNSVLSGNYAKYVGGAIFAYAPSNGLAVADVADTVVFSNNTAACCYVHNKVVTDVYTTSTSCVNFAGGIGDGSEECCPANYYSDGEHCQLCTTELTCAGTVGADTSTVAIANGLWRASTASLLTYSCWNADACVGGVVATSTSTDDYCAAGYKGPCK